MTTKLFEGPCSLSLLLECFVLFGGAGCVSVSPLRLPDRAVLEVDEFSRSVEQSVLRSMTGTTSGSHTKCLPAVAVQKKVIIKKRNISFSVFSTK